MSKEDVIEHIEKVLVRASRDITRKKGSTGEGKLESLSKLLNSYSRLITRSQETDPEQFLELYGDPHYHDRLMKQ